MKRISILISALMVALGAMAIERPVQFNQLPQKAQQLIEQHFAEVGFVHATYDLEVGDSIYDVLLSDGTQIEFNKRGEWRKVECCRGVSIPAALLPEGIVSYVATNHPTQRIVEVECDRREFDVKLSGDIELVFNSKGRIKWYD